MTSRTDAPRIAVLGAGPIGIEAALYAATLGLPVTVYERGRLGEYLHQWGHVRLFSPFAVNCSALGLARLRTDDPGRRLPVGGDLLTGREHLAAYLEPLGKSPLLRDYLRLGTEVLRVGRRGLLKEEGSADARRLQSFRLLLRQSNKERVEEADVVLDCTGTYGQSRGLGDGGIPAAGERAARPHIVAGLEDVLGDRRGHYADRTTLVVGAGYSAATTVRNLVTLAEKHAATWVIWLARGSATQPIRRIVNDPFRERDQLAVRANNLATRGDGAVEFHPQAVVESVECAGADRGFKVAARCAGRLLSWDVDRVIANVGGTPDTDLYRELQVHESYLSLAPMAQAALLDRAGADPRAALRNPEPNFYILGAKSYGRNSSFLLRNGFEQVRDVFALITEDADLRKRFPALPRVPKNMAGP
jgi:thioredoxin reductase